MAAGIETGHARACRSQRVAGATATRPTARASGAPVTARAGQDVRDPGRSQGVAPGRAVALREGTRSTPSPPPSPEVAEPWLEGARDGSVRDRSGRVYKLATIRGYERRLKLRVLPAIGHLKLYEGRRSDVQRIVDSMLGEGRAPRTIQNTIDPLRSIYRRAIKREQVVVNPTVQLEVPAARGRRDRIASPEEGRDRSRASPPSTAHCGRRRCTPACDGASSEGSAGQTSTSGATSSASSERGMTTRERSKGRRSPPSARSLSARTFGASCSSTSSARGATATPWSSE